MKIIDYMIVRVLQDKTQMSDHIESLFNKGWQPLGGVTCKRDGELLQAMVKYAKKVKCKRCNGNGGALGCSLGTPCNLCNGKGFKWEELK